MGEGRKKLTTQAYGANASEDVMISDLDFVFHCSILICCDPMLSRRTVNNASIIDPKFSNFIFNTILP